MLINDTIMDPSEHCVQGKAGLHQYFLYWTFTSSILTMWLDNAYVFKLFQLIIALWMKSHKLFNSSSIAIR